MIIVKTSTEFADDFIKETKDQHANPDAYRGFSMPVQDFMDLTGGYGRSSLTYIFAKEKMGKSSWITTGAGWLGRLGVTETFISLEEPLDLVAQRQFAYASGVSRTKFRDIKLEATDWPHVYQAATEIKGFNAYWVDGVSDIEDVENVIKTTMTDVVWIDYLQLLEVKNAKTMNEVVGRASKFLVRLKKGLITGRGHAVVVSCHLNDDGLPLYSRDPLRDCDTGVHIEAKDSGHVDGKGKPIPLPDQRLCRVSPNRHGETGTFTVGFWGGLSKIGSLQKSKPIGTL